ncbi:MAG TPA: tRNA pseudouridine(38-40) synthase TruA [Candidatus Babeliales bacterium]|nr:tRNA pseudouridine(38-40) synthase TruA [Candidatus Babeliales bacterium]
MKYRYKIVVAYDGTGYFGWQIQNNKPTIAHALQSAFFKVFATSVSVIGVSRTDAGVHAQGQVATFTTERAIDIATIKFAWNNVLPAGITIVDVEQVSLCYNPFANIAYKIYCYYLFVERPLPFVSRYGWLVRSSFVPEKCAYALQQFVGTYNFKQFTTDDDRGQDTIRTIDSIDFEFDAVMGAYKITIKGPKFLRHMIRRVVGAAVEIASRSDLSVDCLKRMLHGVTLPQSLVSAPAQGLLLQSIVYNQQCVDQDIHSEKELS